MPAFIRRWRAERRAAQDRIIRMQALLDTSRLCRSQGIELPPEILAEMDELFGRTP